MDENTIDVKYHKAWVAWLDALGFSELLSDPTKENEVRQHFSALFNDIEAVCFDIRGGYEGEEEQILIQGVKWHIFSDSILLFVFGDSKKKKLFETISCLQALSLKRQKPLRGGITFGDFSVGKYGATGPAFLRAVKLEEQIAIYPRVIIDPLITNDQLSSIRNGLIDKNDSDQIFCINYFGQLSHLDVKKDDLSSFCDSCINWKNPKIAMKYSYLKKKITDNWPQTKSPHP